MQIKKLYYLFIVFILVSIIFISGYEIIKENSTSRELTIKDIAYDVNKRTGYTIYIKENSKFVPYLVLTSNYNGNTLLLRKDLLDKDYIYNDESRRYYSYYKGSFMDNFLNNDYIATLDSQTQNAIVESTIAITTESSYASMNLYTEPINRKIFLLSIYELGFNDLSFLAEEGKPIKYFSNYDRRIAYKNKDGDMKADVWWTRTPYLGSGSGSMEQSSIGPNGGIGDKGIAGFYPEGGVRPAFCIKNTQKIEKNDKVIEGKTVYVISR